MSLSFISQTPKALGIFLTALVVAAPGCADTPPADRARVSGEVETTEVHVASLVPGRILELPVVEGARIEVGTLIAKLDTADAELALARARADRDQATAQLRLVQAGARPEDIRQAAAQVSVAQADASAAQAEASAAGTDLAAADVDVDRFESLVASNSGSRKQRDDAVARRNMARERVQAARQRVEAARGRVRAAQETVERLRAGARREEVDVARTRVAAVESQMAAAATVAVVLGGAAGMREVHAQTAPSLGAIRSLWCSFPVSVSATWESGAPRPDVKRDAIFSFKIDEINLQEGSARFVAAAAGTSPEEDVVAQWSGSSLHFIDIQPDSLTVTTVFDKSSRAKKLWAVHTRTAYVQFALPNDLSEPSVSHLYGECEIGS